MDEAFERYRKEHFGAYAAYPIEAYTYFCAGWRMGANADVQGGTRSIQTRG